MRLPPLTATATGITTPISTELVAFTWDGATAGALDVRARTSRGWSKWVSIDRNPDEGPDAQTREGRQSVTSAGPIWVGAGVRHLEVRAGADRPSNVVLHAIHSTGSVSAPATSAASASPSIPGMISRAGWGADESWRTYSCDGSVDYASGVRNAIVHHTVTANDYTPDQAASIIRGIYYFHTHSNNWCDIGYNFLVDRFGRIYEGRYGGTDKAVIGAHAKGFNTGSTGMAMLGDFTSTTPSSAMLNGLRSLLAWKLAYHGVDPRSTVYVKSLGSDKYATGTVVALPAVSGHRDSSLTGCPGDRVYVDVPTERLWAQSDILKTPPYPLPSWKPAASGPKLAAVNGYGGVQPAGAMPAVSHSAYWPGWDIVRGAAGAVGGGYVLDGWGGIHPFGTTPAAIGGPSWSGWDIARDIVTLPSATTSGYVLDGWGGLHPFGAAPPAVGAPAWPNWDIARSVALLPNGSGGYVLDGWGGLHPFGTAPAVTPGGYWSGWDIARRVVVRPAGGGYVLDGWGGIHPFGGAPAIAGTYNFSGRDVARGLVLTSSGNGGWVLDGDGHLWPVGDATGVPESGSWTGTNFGRALVASP